MKALIAERTDPERAQLYQAASDFVSYVYERAFEAHIRVEPARFAVIVSDAGQVVGAASIRTSKEGFFSQAYLDQPIEKVLSSASGVNISASEIIEVGALSVTSPLMVYRMLRLIFNWAEVHGCPWGVFTTTAKIRSLMARGKMAPVVLAKADASRVVHPEIWGHYYNEDPWVCMFHHEPGAIYSAKDRTRKQQTGEVA